MKKYTCKIVKGKGRGGPVVGFPTINLEIPSDFKQKEGVYACKVFLDGKEYLGALHYGAAPTFDESELVLEIYLLDYGADNTPSTELSFEIGTYLRPVATFMDPTALHTQISMDVARIRRRSSQ